jgi:hypothetical protein
MTGTPAGSHALRSPRRSGHHLRQIGAGLEAALPAWAEATAILAIASSNSWPVWYRSSGRFESDLRMTSSSRMSNPGLCTDGGLGGACTCLAIRVNGPSASLAVKGGWPTISS